MANDLAYQRLAMRIFADFSGTIAVPAVLGALLGKWIDGKFGTAPKAMILCLVLALGFTAVIVIRKAKFYGKKYQELNES